MGGRDGSNARVLRTLERTDSWENEITGLGVDGRDKRRASQFARSVNSQEYYEELVRGNFLCARIVESEPDDMLREGWSFLVEDDNEDIAERVEARADELEVDSKLYEWLSGGNTAGGAGLILGVDDGQMDSPWLPLNEKRIRAFDWMTPLSPRELIVDSYYDKPNAPKYGEPEFYRINATSYGLIQLSDVENVPRIHESRVLHYDAVKVPRRYMRMNFGWGDSKLQRCIDVLTDFGTTWDNVALLLQDFVETRMKIKNLAEAVASGQDGLIRKRADLVQYSKSAARMVLLDAEEDITRDVVSLAGLPQVMDSFAVYVAAAAEMPVTRLMGQSPAGLNATGQADIRWWYDRVRSKQAKLLRPVLNRIVRYIMADLGIAEPANWSIRFEPLWQLNEAELADLRSKQAATDKIYLDAGVVTAEEIALSRFGGDEYSTDTAINADARDEAFKQGPYAQPQGADAAQAPGELGAVAPAPRATAPKPPIEPAVVNATQQ
jgi:phage-related protein (TIGR01555 family)